MRNWVFVRVETDEPGLFGWGEATLEWKTRAVVGALEDLEALLIGQDPRDIEQCSPDHDAARLLAARRRRHVGDQRHRDRALGHSGQVARRAGVAPARRQGPRPSAHLHPSRARRHEGGLREQFGRSDRRARPHRHPGRLRRRQGRVHSLHPLRLAMPRRSTRSPTWSARCATRSDPMSTSWSIFTADRPR